jgi:hypothetical protein
MPGNLLNSNCYFRPPYNIGSVSHYPPPPKKILYLSLSLSLSVDRLCGLVVRVPGYTMEMYCASCEVRTEFIYVM